MALKVLHSKGRDTFGVGIIDDSGRVLANVKDAYTTESGGIHPTEAKLHHIKTADKVIQDAFAQAKIKCQKFSNQSMTCGKNKENQKIFEHAQEPPVRERFLTESDIDLISFSQGPGLPPCLVVGMEKAKALSKRLDIPLVGVNHCICHLEIGKLMTQAKDPVLLYASGANTQVIAYDGGKYRIFGETLDNGIGNFIDGFARHLGLGFPGGPKIAELALKGKHFIELPYVVKGMDISLGGISTNLKQKFDSGKYSKEDLAYSCQETVFAMLVEVSERAMAHCQKKELLLGGGVACNKRLQEMCKIMCDERNAEFYCPENSVLVDNGLMIAWQGILEKHNATKDLEKIDILPKWRTDEVVVDWE